MENTVENLETNHEKWLFHFLIRASLVPAIIWFYFENYYNRAMDSFGFDGLFIILLSIAIWLLFLLIEAFAEVEVYDLKTSKRIYFQKASSMTNLDGKKLIDSRNYTTTPQKQLKEGPFLNFSASQLSEKNLKKILKNIEKYAVK